MPAGKSFTDAMIADGKRRFEETDEPLASIAACFGVQSTTLYRYARKWKWRLRRDRPARDLAPPTTPVMPEAAPDVGTPPPAEPQTPLEIAMRLERAIERQLADVEARANAGAPRSTPDAERIARVLAALARTLKEAQRLRAAATPVPVPDDDDRPFDIDELRRELARRIDAFVAGRADGPVCDAGDAGPG